MMRQGPIGLFLHGVIEYLGAAALIAATFVLGFSGRGAPTAVAIVAGVVVLLMAATTRGLPTSIVKSIPLAAHVTLDYLLAAFFIAAPFLFAFSGDSTPTAFFVVSGVVLLLLAVATRWRPREAQAPVDAA